MRINSYAAKSEPSDSKIKFFDGSSVKFVTGSFDDWCVSYTESDERTFPPKDKQMFRKLLELAQVCGWRYLYDAYVQIYDATSHSIDKDVFTLIDAAALKLDLDSCGKDTGKLLTILYFTMLSEENKAGTCLGKRIKRLGVHQTLVEGMNPNEAANFSKGRRWGDLDDECAKRGF